LPPQIRERRKGCAIRHNSFVLMSALFYLKRLKYLNAKTKEEEAEEWTNCNKKETNREIERNRETEGNRERRIKS